jgi:hypothetical protein
MSGDRLFKRFDKSLYNANDPAKLLAIEYFNKIGKPTVVNPDKYGIDLIVNNEFFCEVEVKHSWKGVDFKYDTLQIPFRKSKFGESTTLPTMFMVMNTNRTHAFLVEGKDVLASPIKEVPNKYMYKGEYFYQIPIDKLTKIAL